MAAKTEKTVVVAPPVKPINFTCKFCGESKPIQDLIVIRTFFPQLTACSECARSKRITDSVTLTNEEKPV